MGVGKAARNRFEERKQEFGFMFVKCAGRKEHRRADVGSQDRRRSSKKGIKVARVRGSPEDG